MPEGTKPLPNSMLTHHQEDLLELYHCIWVDNALSIYHKNLFKKYIIEVTVTFLGGQWVKQNS